jgi:hypothetical protein
MFSKDDHNIADDVGLSIALSEKAARWVLT